MKICQVVSRIDEEASGPSYSVPRLSEALADRKNDVVLATLSSQNKKRTFESLGHMEFRILPFAQKLGISPKMKSWFQKHAGDFSVIHSHGLWMMPNVYPMISAAKCDVISVISPRGTLSTAALSYSPKIKALFWHVVQKRILEDVRAFHATSEEEYIDIRRAGFKQAVAIIPNGIDLTSINIGNHKSRKKRVVSLGRIHPKKGLEMAIEAWSRIEKDFSDWEFCIAGKGDSIYEETLKKLARKKGLDRVSFLGPLYGAEKIDFLNNSSLFLLTTRNENFGMVIAEALVQGIPTICTKGAPWQGLEEHNCGWWVDRSEESISATLRTAMDLPLQRLQEMGLHGRNWMGRDFAWDSIADQMEHFYSWLETGGSRPSYVHID